MAMTPGKLAANLRKGGGVPQSTTGGGVVAGGPAAPGGNRLSRRPMVNPGQPNGAMPGTPPSFAAKPLPVPPGLGSAGPNGIMTPGGPAPATGIEGAIADLKGKLGGGPTPLPEAGMDMATGGPSVGGHSMIGPAQAAIKARLLPRYQEAVAAGRFTPEGAANRQAMFQAGRLPGQAGRPPGPIGADPTGIQPIEAKPVDGGQFSARPMPAPGTPTPAPWSSPGGPVPPPGMDAVTGPGIRVDGRPPLNAEPPGFVTGGGLQYVGPGGGAPAPTNPGLPPGLSGILGANPGPDGRGGNYGAPTFAPGFQTPNFRQMYQDLLTARLQGAANGANGLAGGIGGNVGTQNLIAR